MELTVELENSPYTWWTEDNTSSFINEEANYAIS